MVKKYRKFPNFQRSSPFSADVEDIAYFYAEAVSPLPFYSTKHMVDFTLEALEEQLNPEHFFRINRQIIARVSSIEKIENYFEGKLKIRLKPPHDESIVVSRLRAPGLKEWIGR